MRDDRAHLPPRENCMAMSKRRFSNVSGVVSISAGAIRCINRRTYVAGFGTANLKMARKSPVTPS